MQRGCVQCTKFLDSALNPAESRKTFTFRGESMREFSAQNSGLPSLMMPCPACAGRMAYQGRRAVAPDLEDTVYACGSCGAEVVRTSVRRASSDQPAEAA
jgi:DNA-directed RNA polymerase subunit RPC12/RpoP